VAAHWLTTSVASMGNCATMGRALKESRNQGLSYSRSLNCTFMSATMPVCTPLNDGLSIL